jgi:hypothetical protein
MEKLNQISKNSKPSQPIGFSLSGGLFWQKRNPLASKPTANSSKPIARAIP